MSVADASLGSVTVDVSHDRVPVRRWSTTAQAGQPGRLSGLAAGVCHIRVSAASGSVQLDLEVRAGETISLVVQATAGRLELVLRDRETTATDLNARALQALPPGSGVWGLVDAASPFVVGDRIDTGGLSLGTPPRLGGRAASWMSATADLGGEVAHGTTGLDRIALQPDVSSIEAVRVLPGVVSAESSSPGARIVLVPRLPDRARRTTFEASFTAPGMVATNSTEAAPSIARLDSWGGAALQSGGPLGARAGLFVSGSASGMRDQERERGALVSASVATALAHFMESAY